MNSSTSNPYNIETNVGKNGADPCYGDSGGPLLLREGLEWVLVGTLIGGGFDCAIQTRHDNTSDWNNVASHVPWIRSLIGGN